VVVVSEAGVEVEGVVMEPEMTNQIRHPAQYLI